ncbi:MAG: formate dehydrogenase accessory sulfurtransferase FdhD [Rectinema sp.]|nr:formate dehydrogenase accessory sulfurtransferase FdhD [Rectinema sp.]
MRAEKEGVPLAPEYPVDLIADGMKLATFMCTPVSLEELAVGYLCSIGMIRSISRIAEIVVADDLRSVSVRLASTENAGVLPSGNQQTRWPVTIESLKAKAAEMFSRAEMYRQTGGMHCAALWTLDDTIITREDVGRHNAVDKVIGRGILDGTDLSQAVLLTSGRFAADMVMKAKNAGIQLLVTRSIPTSTAYEIAIKAGLTIVGRIETASPIIYTCRERITTRDGAWR